MSLEQILLLVLSLIVVVIGIVVVRLYLHYTRLTASVSQKDLITSLNHLISVSVENSEAIKKITEKVDTEIQENKKHLQKEALYLLTPTFQEAYPLGPEALFESARAWP